MAQKMAPKSKNNKAAWGKKVGMTRLFSDQGESLPVTVLEISPNVIYQVKTKEKDGYSAVQVGIEQQKPQRVNRPKTGHCGVAKKGMPMELHEIRLDRPGREIAGEYAVGQEITVNDLFTVGARVDVVGTSIGRGFAGVMKRHNMAGFSATHGTHEYFRHGGSIGNRKFPGRVFKNKRMGGHMGCDRVLAEGLEVVAVRPEENVLLLRGSVPGAKNSYVFVRSSLKHS